MQGDVLLVGVAKYWIAAQNWIYIDRDEKNEWTAYIE